MTENSVKELYSRKPGTTNTSSLAFSAHCHRSCHTHYTWPTQADYPPSIGEAWKSVPSQNNKWTKNKSKLIKVIRSQLITNVFWSLCQGLTPAVACLPGASRIFKNQVLGKWFQWSICPIMHLKKIPQICTYHRQNGTGKI